MSIHQQLSRQRRDAQPIFFLPTRLVRALLRSTNTNSLGLTMVQVLFATEIFAARLFLARHFQLPARTELESSSVKNALPARFRTQTIRISLKLPPDKQRRRVSRFCQAPPF